MLWKSNITKQFFFPKIYFLLFRIGNLPGINEINFSFQKLLHMIMNNERIICHYNQLRSKSSHLIQMNTSTSMKYNFRCRLHVNINLSISRFKLKNLCKVTNGCQHIQAVGLSTAGTQIHQFIQTPKMLTIGQIKICISCQILYQ